MILEDEKEFALRKDVRCYDCGIYGVEPLAKFLSYRDGDETEFWFCSLCHEVDGIHLDTVSPAAFRQGIHWLKKEILKALQKKDSL